MKQLYHPTREQRIIMDELTNSLGSEYPIKSPPHQDPTRFLDLCIHLASMDLRVCMNTGNLRNYDEAAYYYTTLLEIREQAMISRAARPDSRLDIEKALTKKHKELVDFFNTPIGEVA